MSGQRARRRSPGPCSVQAERALEVASRCSPWSAGPRRRAGAGRPGRSPRRRSARAACSRAPPGVCRVVPPRDEAVGGEDGQPWSCERDEAHEHVAVLALAADLLGVDARGLVAVVAVGDEQLGGLQRGRKASIAAGSATRHRRLTVPSASVSSPNGSAALSTATTVVGSNRRRGGCRSSSRDHDPISWCTCGPGSREHRHGCRRRAGPGNSPCSSGRSAALAMLRGRRRSVAAVAGSRTGRDRPVADPRARRTRSAVPQLGVPAPGSALSRGHEPLRIGPHARQGTAADRSHVQSSQCYATWSHSADGLASPGVCRRTGARRQPPSPPSTALGASARRGSSRAASTRSRPTAPGGRGRARPLLHDRQHLRLHPAVEHAVRRSAGSTSVAPNRSRNRRLTRHSLATLGERGHVPLVDAHLSTGRRCSGPPGGRRCRRAAGPGSRPRRRHSTRRKESPTSSVVRSSAAKHSVDETMLRRTSVVA